MFELNTDSLSGFQVVERRKKSRANRVRRFVNSYWLVPVLFIYMELFAIILPPVHSPLTNFTERNLSFIRGPVIIYNLFTTDFPHALTGHIKEIVFVKKYQFNVDQVPSIDISKALEDKETIRKIHERLVASRGYSNTELGGIATLSYASGRPKLRLYEITSLNKAFSDKLHVLEDASIEEFLSFIQEKESRELLETVEMNKEMTNTLIEVLSSDKPGKYHKMMFIRDFIKTYDIYSEIKYILSPYDFKSFLGSAELEGQYIGIFHFHNNYMEPPSTIDVGNSYSDRQLVFTLSDRGIAVYDVVKGKERLYIADVHS